MRFLVLLLSLFISTSAMATAQFPDLIVIDGKQESLLSNPFTALAARAEIRQKLEPLLGRRCTASVLGYTASWEIRDQRSFSPHSMSTPVRKIRPAFP